MNWKRPLMLFILTCCSTVLVNAQVTTTDYRILRALAKTRTETMNKFFILVSDLNNPLCLTVMMLLLLSRFVMKEHRYFRAGLLLGQSIIFSQSITFLCKDLIGRLRPQLYDTTFLSVISANNKSFPSGHTSEAFTFAVALAVAFPNWWVRILAFGWACTVAYARMYLGVHYPSDVFGGIVVGAGSVWLVVALTTRYGKYKERRSDAIKP